MRKIWPRPHARPYSALLVSWLVFGGLVACAASAFAADPFTFDLPKAEFQLSSLPTTPSKIPPLLTLKGGTPPYTVQVSSDAVTLEPYRSPGPSKPGAPTSYRITPKKAGVAEVTMRDAAGQVRTARITVLAAPESLATTLSDPVIDLGKSVTLSVTGGTPPYRLDVPSGTRFRIDRVAEGQYRITGMVAGGGGLTVVDSKGNTRGVALQAAPLKLQANRTSLGIGEVVELTIAGGTAQHAVTVAPADAASLSQKSATLYAVTARRDGPLTILVKDAEGKSGSVQVTVVKPAAPPSVAAPPEFKLELTPTAIHVRDYVQPPKEAVLKIVGGTPPYTVTQHPDFRLTLTKESETNYRVTGRYPGGEVHQLQVKDAAGKQVSAQLYITRPLAIRCPQQDVIIPEHTPGRIVSAPPVSIQILNGEGPFTVQNPNADLVAVGPPADGRRPTYDRPQEIAATVALTGKAPGTAIVRVGDKNIYNQCAVKVVRFAPPPAPPK